MYWCNRKWLGYWFSGILCYVLFHTLFLSGYRSGISFFFLYQDFLFFIFYYYSLYLFQCLEKFFWEWSTIKTIIFWKSSLERLHLSSCLYISCLYHRWISHSFTASSNRVSLSSTSLMVFIFSFRCTNVEIFLPTAVMKWLFSLHG